MNNTKITDSFNLFYIKGSNGMHGVGLQDVQQCQKQVSELLKFNMKGSSRTTFVPHNMALEEGGFQAPVQWLVTTVVANMFTMLEFTVKTANFNCSVFKFV